jgi:hypothetical protein
VGAPQPRGGTAGTVKPQTVRGRQWLHAHIGPEAQWFGFALVVETRYLYDLLQGALDAGLVVVPAGVVR